MLEYYRAVRQASARIAVATRYAAEAYREGRVEQEPQITDRMLAAIERSLDAVEIHGITWTAKTLTDRGRASQESRCGADFMGVLDIDLPDYRVRKGFLAQAKMAKKLSKAELTDLHSQCERMLQLTPASYVFLYGKDDFYVVPAVSVVGGKRQPLEHYKRTIQRFYEEHLECFIGDRAIQSATPSALKSLVDSYDARKTLIISARGPLR